MIIISKNKLIYVLLIVIGSFCGISAKLSRVYEENPFLNGKSLKYHLYFDLTSCLLQLKH